MTDTRQKRPVWKWILLFVGASFLALFGYGLLQTMFLLTDEVGLPFLLIFPSIIYLGLYALFVMWFEKRWPTDLPLRRLIPHTLLGLLVGFVFMVMAVGTTRQWDVPMSFGMVFRGGSSIGQSCFS